MRRERTDIKSDAKSITYAYGITSVSSADASAQQLLAWNRGHWAIESENHQRRDKTLDEDACLARSGLAPANRATCNNLVLALILHRRRWHNAAAALRYFTLHRKAALQTLLRPTEVGALPAPLSGLSLPPVSAPQHSHLGIPDADGSATCRDTRTTPGTVTDRGSTAPPARKRWEILPCSLVLVIR